MPRRPRVFVEGALYHVYNRVARGAEVFGEGAEAERFLELVRTVRERDGWTVHAWCVMSNHYHLAVRTGPVPLARSMAYVQARFAAGYNRRRRSSGPLWQSRYKAKLLEHGDSLLRVIAYIHLNPVVAGLVEDPAEYPHSGHRELLGRVASPLIAVNEVLSIYGGSLRQARRAYVAVLGGVGGEEWRTELPGRLPWWGHEPDRPLELPPPVAMMDAAGRTSGLERPEIEAGAFLELACEAIGVSPSELAAVGQGLAASRLRYLVATLAIERWRIRAGEIARLVGRRPEVVSRWARRGGELRRSDSDFLAELERVDEALSEALRG